MRKRTITISPKVLDVLQRSTVSGNTLRLPEQLSPPDYKEVKKILDAAGGVWQRKHGCHLFNEPVSEALGVALETGSILDAKKTYQAFYTPQPLAERLANLVYTLLGGKDEAMILEPSAGLGAIVTELERIPGFDVTCVEVNPKSVEALDASNPDIWCIPADFLKVNPAVLGDFDAVAMNPPFTGDQDAEHVLHAWDFLKPMGVLVAIVSPRYTFADTPKARKLARLVEDHAEMEEDIPAGTFKESGTEVRTRLIALRKQ